MANIKRTSPVTAAKVKQARGSLTQIEAAEASGISRRALQTYESGDVAMSEADFEHFKKQVAKLNKTKREK
jgi:transcriptional regulator with XRE-family HTH domain